MSDTIHFIFGICAIINACSCQSNNKDPDTILYKFDHPDQNGYEFKYKTSDGIERSEKGVLKEESGELKLEVEGSFQYKRPDGKIQFVTYTAGENGYRPVNSNPEAAPTVATPKGKNSIRGRGFNRLASHVLSSLVGGGIG